MRFATLGSGSRGNATLVESESTRLLVDNGFSLRELERRLARLGVEPQGIEALLLTHEHADHAKGVAAFAARYGATVWTTPGTWKGRRSAHPRFPVCGSFPDTRAGSRSGI